MPKTEMQKAVFLDRDGVINLDHGYVYQPEQFEFIDGVFEACRHFQSQGYLLIVVTNQSGIGRGFYSEASFASLTRWMQQTFLQHGVDITGVYYCPHHPTQGKPPYNIACNCRKPLPGMLLQAIHEHHINPTQSMMLGDKQSDMQAAAAAGIGTKILVRSGQTLSETAIQSADEVWPSIKQAISTKN